VASGNILRMNSDGTALEVFANTGGRVLGFDFDAAGNLIAADAINGLLSISPDKKLTVLTDKVGGDPIRYADAVVVAANGKMYVSDASTRFAPAQWGGTFEASVLDILEQSATGRILEYDPATRATRIVARGLSFANGVALSQDEQTLFVNETGKYRVWKITVKANDLDVAQPSPLASVLFDNLPGYPDNLMRGLDGKIWLGFAKPRNPTIDKMAGKPFLRALTLRLPRALWPIPKAYGHVMAFTEDGKVVADLQDPSGAYPETTAVTETRDRLYIQSLHAKGLGWLAK
jgi:sugar lactone lactonase YvrE